MSPHSTSRGVGDALRETAPEHGLVDLLDPDGVADPLAAYVPRIAAEWDLDAPDAGYQEIDATLCFVDISGFTRLSERLAQRGRIGAEKLTEVLTEVFGTMLDRAYLRGGNLLKFGGDSLLLMFRGPDHTLHASCAAVELRSALREASQNAGSMGHIDLRMSAGIHTGPVHAFMVGDGHRELVVTGPTVSTTTGMEKAAAPGEIVVSPTVAAALPSGATSGTRGEGRLLRWRKAPMPPGQPIPRRWVGREAIARCVPVSFRDFLRRPTLESEHRLATVGFLRFEGIDGLIDQHGPAAAWESLQQLIGWVQTAVEREGVGFLATDIDRDGGKVILVSGVPAAREDDEGRMLRAVSAILDAPGPLSLRAGINRGHVFAGQVGNRYRRTYTVIGDTVNLGARLMAAAPPGEIYTRRTVLDSAYTRFESTQLEPLFMKGIAAPVVALSVGRELGRKATSPDHKLPLVGRVEELGVLVGLLERLRRGEGGTVIVIGETGIGKTRLVEESLALAGDGLWTLEARGEPAALAFPYRALRDPLLQLLEIERTSDGGQMRSALERRVMQTASSLAPFLPLIADVAHIEVPDTAATAAIEPRFRREGTAAAILELLEAVTEGPGVIFIDDAHYLDEASTHLVERLITAGAGRPWLVIATRRPEPTGLQPESTMSIDLQPLTAEETERLVVAATDGGLRTHEITELVGRAGGNPLFVNELVTAFGAVGSVAMVPDTLDGLIRAQIDALSPLARRVLMYASVFGRSLRPALLHQMLAEEQIELDNATRFQLDSYLTPQGRDRLSFRHALVRDTAYHGLSFRRRAQLHARAGRIIETRAGDNLRPVAGSLAQHYFEAKDFPRAWRFGRMAGDWARETYANTTAAEHYERALEAARRLDDVSDDQRAEVLTAIGDVCEQAGMFDEALAAFRQATRLRHGNPIAVAELLGKRARTRTRMGAYSAALRETTIGTRALAGMDAPEAVEARARLGSLAGVIRLQQGNPRRALDHARSAVADAESVGDKVALARAYSVLAGAHQMLGEPSKAEYAELALGIYREIGDMAGVGTVANELGIQSFYKGDWKAAVAFYRQACDAFRQAGNEAQAAAITTNIAEVLVNQGRIEEAEPLLSHAERVLRAHRLIDQAIFATLQSARVRFACGLHQEALRLLESARDEAIAVGQAHNALQAEILLASAHRQMGKPRDAMRILERAERSNPRVAELFGIAISDVRAAALADVGAVDAAAELAERAIEEARAQELAYETALLTLLADDLASRSGRGRRRDVEEAERLLHELDIVWLPDRQPI